MLYILKCINVIYSLLLYICNAKYSLCLQSSIMVPSTFKIISWERNLDLNSEHLSLILGSATNLHHLT